MLHYTRKSSVQQAFGRALTRITVIYMLYFSVALMRPRPWENVMHIPSGIIRLAVKHGSGKEVARDFVRAMTFEEWDRFVTFWVREHAVLLREAEDSVPPEQRYRGIADAPEEGVEAITDALIVRRIAEQAKSAITLVAIALSPDWDELALAYEYIDPPSNWELILSTRRGLRYGE